METIIGIIAVFLIVAIAIIIPIYIRNSRLKAETTNNGLLEEELFKDRRDEIMERALSPETDTTKPSAARYKNVSSKDGADYGPIMTFFDGGGHADGGGSDSGGGDGGSGGGGD